MSGFILSFGGVFLILSDSWPVVENVTYGKKATDQVEVQFLH